MGVEVSTRRLWERAQELHVARLVYVNMLDRERADFFRTLDSLKEAFGPHVVATEIPIGAEHERQRPDRPRGHEGLRVRRRRQLHGDPDPGRPRRAGAGVPREADGRGRGELRGADGALPGGRGDLPRRDRHTRSRRAPTTATSSRSPAAWPRRAWARTGCWTRSSTTSRRPPSTSGVAGRGGLPPRARPRGRDVRLRVQDARRPVRGPHQPLPRLPGHDDPRHAGDEHPHPSQGARRPAARAARQGGQPRRRVRPGRHRRGGQAQGDPRRRLAGGARPADPHAAHQASRAGHGLRHGAQEQGRRGQGPHRPAAPAGGGPDDRPAPRRADRRADRRRPVADPRRGDRRPDEVALRRRGDAQAAARALPGDDPRLRQGPRAPQEADRRPRPVRRLPHRDRAAARRRVRVRQRDQGRRDPARLHPGGREGRARGDAAGRRGRLPGQGRAGDALRRLLPHGRLVGDGVQARGLARHAPGARAGRRGAAGADHARHLLGPGRVRGRRDGRSELPPRAPAGHRGASAA